MGFYQAHSALLSPDFVIDTFLLLYYGKALHEVRMSVFSKQCSNKTIAVFLVPNIIKQINRCRILTFTST